MFVFHIFSLLLILKCLAVSTSSETVNTTITDTQVGKTTQGLKPVPTIEPPANEKKNNSALIITEGGDKVSTHNLATSTPMIEIEAMTKHTDIKSTLSLPVRTYGREGELVDNKSSKNDTNATADKIQSNNTLIEEVSVLNDTKSTNISRSGSVPRKGVEFTPDQLNMTSTVATSTTSKTTTAQPTTVKKQIHKPTVTTGSEDNKDALVKEKVNNSTPKVPTIEYYRKTKEEYKRSTFIIPIVAVILSVPLVAILVNILYKRGKEWWSHRHYRRMDFLIDGMYNN